MNFKKTFIMTTVMSALLGGMAVYAETETHTMNGTAAVVSSSSIKMHEEAGLSDAKKAETKKAHEAKRAEMEAKKMEMKKARDAKKAEMVAKKAEMKKMYEAKKAKRGTASTTPIKSN